MTTIEIGVVGMVEVFHYLPGFGPALLTVDGLQVSADSTLS